LTRHDVVAIVESVRRALEAIIVANDLNLVLHLAVPGVARGKCGARCLQFCLSGARGGAGTLDLLKGRTNRITGVATRIRYYSASGEQLEVELDPNRMSREDLAGLVDTLRKP
jgi:hypothetical protein